MPTVLHGFLRKFTPSRGQPTISSPFRIAATSDSRLNGAIGTTIMTDRDTLTCLQFTRVTMGIVHLPVALVLDPSPITERYGHCAQLVVIRKLRIRNVLYCRRLATQMPWHRRRPPCHHQLP
jgi:hypothetical protein